MFLPETKELSLEELDQVSRLTLRSCMTSQLIILPLDTGLLRTNSQTRCLGTQAAGVLGAKVVSDGRTAGFARYVLLNGRLL